MSLNIKSGYNLNENIREALGEIRAAIENAVEDALRTRDLEWSEAVWGDYDANGAGLNDALHPGYGPDDAEAYVVTLQGRHPHDDRKPSRSRKQPHQAARLK